MKSLVPNDLQGAYPSFFILQESHTGSTMVIGAASGDKGAISKVSDARGVHLPIDLDLYRFHLFISTKKSLIF